MLYCHGYCGDNWFNKTLGCQQSDADVYCKLIMCNVKAYATNYDLGVATNNPGFVCDGHGKNFGNWFGIKGIWFDEDVSSSHCEGTCTYAQAVVRNVKCDVQGMYHI